MVVGYTWNQTGPCRALQGTKTPLCLLCVVCKGKKKMGGGFRLLGPPQNLPKNRLTTLVIREMEYRTPSSSVWKEITIWWISSSCSAEIKTPIQVEDGDCMLTTSLQIADWLESEGWDSRTITLLPHHQPIRSAMSWSDILRLSPLTLSLKTLAWKPSKEFWSFEHELPALLATNLSQLQTPVFQFDLAVHQEHENLGSITN